MTEIFLPNFNVFRKDRHDGSGGVLVVTKKIVMCHEIKPASTTETESVTVQIQRNENLIVSSLYRPPSATSENKMTDFMKTLDTNSPKENNIIWIIGDLNLPDIDWETNSIQGNSYPRTVNRQFLDKINDLGLHQANHEPPRGEINLDLFLTTDQA